MQRPDCELEILISHLQEERDVNSHCFSKGTTYLLNSSNSILLLHHGDVSYYSQGSDKLIFQLQAPFVLGLTKLMTLNENYYIKCDTDINVSFVNANLAHKKIEDLNLWKYSLKIICYLNYITGVSVLSGANSYDILKKSLNELWQLPKIERERVSIFEYTMNKYHISRSSIAKILKQLNNGLYIKTKRGVLIELNRLPEKY